VDPCEIAVANTGRAVIWAPGHECGGLWHCSRYRQTPARTL